MIHLGELVLRHLSVKHKHWARVIEITSKLSKLGLECFSEGCVGLAFAPRLQALIAKMPQKYATNPHNPSVQNMLAT